MQSVIDKILAPLEITIFRFVHDHPYMTIALFAMLTIIGKNT